MKRRTASIHNILTFDVEDWYQALDIPDARWSSFEKRLSVGLEFILQRLAECGVKATGGPLRALLWQTFQVSKNLEGLSGYRWQTFQVSKNLEGLSGYRWQTFQVSKNLEGLSGYRW